MTPTPTTQQQQFVTLYLSEEQAGWLKDVMQGPLVMYRDMDPVTRTPSCECLHDTKMRKEIHKALTTKQPPAMPEQEHIGKNLRAWRIANRIGLREFAEILGVLPSDYASFEQGEIERIPGWVPPVMPEPAKEQAKIEYAWRGARPEDAGKGYEAMPSSDGVYYLERDANRILVGYEAGSGEPWLCHKPNYVSGRTVEWKFCQVYAPVDPAPAPEQAASEGSEVDRSDYEPIPIGSGKLKAGDCYKEDGKFVEIPENCIGDMVCINGFYRRRVPAPQVEAKRFDTAGREVTGLNGLYDESDCTVPQVDIVRHEVEELRKANAALLGENQRLKEEHDWQKKANLIVVKEHNSRCDEKRQIELENAGLRQRVAELEQENTSLEQRLARESVEYGELERMHDIHESECHRLTAERDTLAAKLAELTKPKEEGEEWRELTTGDQYNGPGQVRNDESDDWRYAYIAAADNIGNYPFLARPVKDLYNCWRFARVRVK